MVATLAGSKRESVGDSTGKQHPTRMELTRDARAKKDMAGRMKINGEGVLGSVMPRPAVR